MNELRTYAFVFKLVSLIQSFSNFETQGTKKIIIIIKTVSMIQLLNASDSYSIWYTLPNMTKFSQFYLDFSYKKGLEDKTITKLRQFCHIGYTKLNYTTKYTILYPSVSPHFSSRQWRRYRTTTFEVDRIGFGSLRHGQETALHNQVCIIENAMYQGEIALCLFLDVEGTFDNTSHEAKKTRQHGH